MDCKGSALGRQIIAAATRCPQRSLENNPRSTPLNRRCECQCPNKMRASDLSINFTAGAERPEWRGALYLSAIQYRF